jgi:DNA-binding transcriptional LysR family regulator
MCPWGPHVFPDVDSRHLHAAVVLAEELNFTRAAHILGISQPALSKLITDLEKRYRLHLFVRVKGRIIAITEAGKAFVREARLALFHTERAIHLAHAAHEGIEHILRVGYSHYADRDWISTLVAVRLPLYKLKVRLLTRAAIDLVHSVLTGELDLALVTAPPKDRQLTAVSFAKVPLHVALRETHTAAQKEHIELQDLATDEWILLAKDVHPIVHDAILETAECAGINPKNSHDVMTAHQAIHLVAERIGIAVFLKPAGFRFHEEGVVVRPLSDTTLWFDTCLIMRAEDNPRYAEEFAMAFLRKVAPKRAPANQMKLPLPA